MHSQLKELHQDHINLAHVLHLLESLLGEVRAGEHIDLNALSEIVDYVQTYPDLIHHKREDVIFSVYLEHRATDRNELVNRLMAEHVLLVKKTLEIREHIEQWCNDSPVPRERVVAIIADYLQMQWDHLNLEESSVFDLLDQELEPEDWARIEASMPAATDPLFGRMMRQRFEHIFDRLLAA